MPRFFILIGIPLISFSPIFVRLAGVTPITATFFRALYALPVLVPLWLGSRTRDRRPQRARWLALSSGLVLAVDLSFWHHSIDLIGAGLSTVLANTQVVFVGVVAWMLHRERPTSWAFIVVPLVFSGVVCISGLGRPDAYGENPARGTVFGLLTGISYASFLLLFRQANRHLGPAAGPLLDATTGTAVGAFLLGLFDSGFRLAPSWPAHGWLLGLAVAAQAVGWLLIATALPHLPALETSVMLLTQPMLSVVWAWILFREHLSPLQWMGVGLVLGGVALLSLRGSVEEAQPIAEEP